MPAPTPAETLRKNRERAVALAQKAGSARTKALLQKAQRDLEKRIVEAEGLRGPGAESFTAVQLRVTLRQVEDVLRQLRGGLHGVVLDAGKIAAEQAARGTLDYLAEQEQHFRGVSEQPLALDQAAIVDQAVSGAQSSVLRRLMSDPADPRGRGILDRYGNAVVGKFEEQLQLALVTRKPWADIRQSLIDQSPFLQGAPAHWAERIVRTEMMAANNAANMSTIQQADESLGDMVKILSATFDGRTAADSYAVHGQIRRTNEPFDTWQGKVMHPPARPNDREVVVPHRISWPIPAYLEPRSGEVGRVWTSAGNKKPHPPIPPRSTVPVEQFGKQSPPAPRPAAVPPEVLKSGYAENYRAVAGGVSDGDLDYLRTGMRRSSTATVNRVYASELAKGRTVDEVATQVMDPIRIDLSHDGKQYLVDGRHRWTAAREQGASAVRATVHQYGPRGAKKWVREMVVPIR